MTHQPITFDIQNKVILVTGANRGIGKSLVETFLKHGAKKIYAAVRNLDTALPLAEKHGAKIQAIHLDLADPASIHAAAVAASDVDMVVNNAAILKNVDPLDPTSVEIVGEQFAINVQGMLRVVHAFAPVLKSNGGGVYVQINSSASMRCSAPFSTYASTKAASYSLCQGLRTRLAEQNTYLLSVHPGPILTDMAVAAGIDDGASPPELVGEAMIESLRKGDFLCFPDPVSQEVGAAYQPFADQYFSG